jgi:signal transduction histidine kinase
LIENAAKYSPPGSPIVVTARREKDSISLSVSDSGDGIPPDELPHIFDPFFRGKKGRRDGRQGAGLGLAIARRIAETFNASLTAESVLGEGSVFTVAFPALRDEGERAVAAGVERQRASSESRQAGESAVSR